MNPTPDTLAYLILGLIVGFGIIGLYIGSLFVRFNNLRRDLKTLRELDA